MPCRSLVPNSYPPICVQLAQGSYFGGAFVVCGLDNRKLFLLDKEYTPAAVAGAPHKVRMTRKLERSIKNAELVPVAPARTRVPFRANRKARVVLQEFNLGL
jgi:hypothetical protein